MTGTVWIDPANVGKTTSRMEVPVGLVRASFLRQPGTTLGCAIPLRLQQML